MMMNEHVKIPHDATGRGMALLLMCHNIVDFVVC